MRLAVAAVALLFTAAAIGAAAGAAAPEAAQRAAAKKRQRPAGEPRPAKVKKARDREETRGARRVDRILAIVDEDPILESDVEQALRLGLVAAGNGDAAPEAAGETAAETASETAAESDRNAVRREVLDRLIEERLRFHEIDRFGFTEISLDEVDRAYQQIRDRFASPEAFAARLEDVDLDPDGLRQLVARQIMVLTYVEERLGSRVFVGLDDIRSYYNETLQPELAALGRSVPPLAEVREEIRAVIREQRLNEEIERWTEQLRIEADIDDFFDSPLKKLPRHLIDEIELEDGA